MKGKKKGSREKNVEWRPREISDVAKENIKVENAICLKKKKKTLSTTPSKGKRHNVLTDPAKVWKELREK